MLPASSKHSKVMVSTDFIDKDDDEVPAKRALTIVTPEPPLTTTAGQRNSRHLSVMTDDPYAKDDSTRKTKRSGTSSKSGKSGKSSRSRSSRRTLLVTKPKLPPDFHENVIDLEFKVEQGQFNMETINTLMELYSQAVEYYNGLNDNKFTIYQDRIQNILCKPDIQEVMSRATKNPEAYAKEQEEKKKEQESLTAE